jgi:hypothetical protein
MKLKELCKYCEWNHSGHCTMGNDSWKALMAEKEVTCKDFEPINLCNRCSKICKISWARVVDCPSYESKGRDE